MRHVAFALVLAGCTPAKEPKHVSFRMVGTPANATVTIDDIFVGRLETVQARGVALPVGQHHLTVEAPGYFPFDKVIEAKEGAPIRVEARLVAVPD
jgi:hypothetical protein